MKNLIKWQEKSFFYITNRQIENLKNQNLRDKYLELKLLYNHIETYKTIIDNLLENEQTNAR